MSMSSESSEQCGEVSLVSLAAESSRLAESSLLG